MSGITFSFEHADGKIHTVKVGFMTTVLGFVKDVAAGVRWRDLKRVVIERG